MLSAGTQLARFLGRHRKLVLSYDWEDQDWLDKNKTRDGTLPGEGFTSYMLRVSPIDQRDEWEEGDTLQEFHYNGGGDDLSEKQVPPEVKEAFEKWYGKLSLAAARTGLTIRFVGRLESEDAVDRLLEMVRSASPHLPMWIAELNEEWADRAKANSDVGGRFSEARVKGVAMRLHRDGEEVPLAFVDHGDHWVMKGLVKTQPTDFPDDEAKIIWLFEIMMHQGVELKATDDGKSNTDVLAS
ncbi:MAG TPA: hypothetical protein VKF39_06655 [Nitrososphaerales archaeon]|nr:hypothetical protein [Nitrososphaerales archaeon]